MDCQKDKAVPVRGAYALEAESISLPGGKLPTFQGNPGEFVLLSGPHGAGKTLFFRSILRVEDCRQSLLQGGQLSLAEGEVKQLWRPGAAFSELSLRLPVENFALSPSFHHSVKVGDIFPFEAALRRAFAEQAEIVCFCGNSLVRTESLSGQIEQVSHLRTALYPGSRLIVSLRGLRELGPFMSLMRGNGFRKGILKGAIVDLDSRDSESASEVVIWRSSANGASEDELLREYSRARDLAEGEITVYADSGVGLEVLKVLDSRPRCESCGLVFQDPQAAFSAKSVSAAGVNSEDLKAYRYKGRCLSQWLNLSFDQLLLDFLSVDFLDLEYYPQIPFELFRHIADYLRQSKELFSLSDPLRKVAEPQRRILRMLALLLARPYGRAFIFDGMFDDEERSVHTAPLAGELLKEIASLGNLVMASHVPSNGCTDGLQSSGLQPSELTSSGLFCLADRVYAITRAIDSTAGAEYALQARDFVGLRRAGRELLGQLRSGAVPGRFLFDALGFASELAQALSLTPQARREGLTPAELLVPYACCHGCGGRGRVVSLTRSGLLSVDVCSDCAGLVFCESLSEPTISGHSLCDFFRAPIRSIASMYPWNDRLIQSVNALCAAGAGAYTLDCEMEWIRAECS